jgi:hypothetical protein
MGKALNGNIFYVVLLINSGIALFLCSKLGFHYWVILVPFMALLISIAITVSIREYLQWRKIKKYFEKEGNKLLHLRSNGRHYIVTIQKKNGVVTTNEFVSTQVDRISGIQL